jgi:dTDP-4-dehydrorhamnose 3,5-epimerase
VAPFSRCYADDMTSDSAPPHGQLDEERDREPDEAMSARIQGVRVRRIAGYHDHRGALFPLVDAGDPFWSEPIVYGYLFTVRPGRIKGWGMHRRQTDRYVVLSGCLRVVLFDGREESPDRGNFCDFHFTPGSVGELHIPPGVWHATQNWGKTLGRVFNLPTSRHDPAHPDKYRIDPASGEIPFDWRLRDG